MFLHFVEALGKEIQRKQFNWTEAYFKPQPPAALGFWDSFLDTFKSQALREAENNLRNLQEYRNKLDNYWKASREDTDEFSCGTVP